MRRDAASRSGKPFAEHPAAADEETKWRVIAVVQVLLVVVVAPLVVLVLVQYNVLLASTS
jgi:hypothetical protein